MELGELEQRLTPFCQHHYGEDVSVSDVFQMPGHAGFSYGFSVQHGEGLNKEIDKWYMRLPPPNVKLQGTADVLGQVAVLNVLPQAIPHCAVKWSGDDPQWFGRPYFIVPQLEGDVVRVREEAISSLVEEQRLEMAKQAIEALAAIHRIDWSLVPYLGDPLSLEPARSKTFIVGKNASPNSCGNIPRRLSMVELILF